jgi:hypothetical protein
MGDLPDVRRTARHALLGHPPGARCAVDPGDHRDAGQPEAQGARAAAEGGRVSIDVIGALARYEVVVDATGMGGGRRVFRFTSRADVLWALGFGEAPDLVAAGVKTTARDRWTGRPVTAR